MIHDRVIPVLPMTDCGKELMAGKTRQRSFSSRRPMHWSVGMVLGCAAALLLSEAILRLIATPSAGEICSEGIRVRSYAEGFASATFARDGARLTGNQSLSHAAIGLILGDSHVEALEIQDRDTMGSVLERLLRNAGESINIRQYGESGQSAPKYCLVAPFLIQRWSPSWVIVILNKDDLRLEPFEGPARFVLGPANSVSLIGPKERSYLGPTSLNVRSSNSMGDFVRRHSVLGTLWYRRWKELRRIAEPTSKTSLSSGEIAQMASLAPALSVRELKKAYGSRLLIAYDPDLVGSDDRDAKTLEKRFLNVCQMEKVQCHSLGEALNPAYWTRGFSNTLPNVGHYNASGHRRIAETLFKVLRQQPASERD